MTWIKYFTQVIFLLQDDARQFFSMASAPGEDGKLSYELGMIMKRLWHDHGVQVDKGVLEERTIRYYNTCSYWRPVSTGPESTS